MIELLNIQEGDALSTIAKLMIEAFPWCYRDEKEIQKEILDTIHEGGIVFVAKEKGAVIGVIGAIKQYGHTGWELHPLIVKATHQKNKIGTKLLCALEQEVRNRGGIVMYLGTDDEFFKTSLSKVDLFDNTFSHIERIENIDHHPFAFYQKNGYKIVGVIPDANGFNKPDILMAKRLVPYQSPNDKSV